MSDKTLSRRHATQSWTWNIPGELKFSAVMDDETYSELSQSTERARNVWLKHPAHRDTRIVQKAIGRFPFRLASRQHRKTSPWHFRHRSSYLLKPRVHSDVAK